MDLTSIWQTIRPKDKRDLYIALTIPVLGATAIRLISSALQPSARRRPNILPSPRKSLQGGPKDPDDLPYPPDALPGARDVDSPYGNVRVYEWGPEEGRKVLFCHGISTPSIAFAGMAQALVERGCRVMLFDYFGRGYSDAPDPGVYRQDMALWTSQILLVLASSGLAWTGGSERFALVGYSMGGGIAATFTSYFPELVESLILVAPGGLLRPSRINTSSKLLYGNLLPSFLVDYFVGRRLRGSSSTSHPAVGGKAKGESTTAAESELPGHPANAADSTAPMFPDRPRISVARAVEWQADVHPGFLPSFISSLQYAPVSHEHDRWRLVGRRCSARRTSSQRDKLPGLDEDKVLIILGAQDSVIVADETEEDATAAFGRENVEVVRLEGGHDVAIANFRGCADAIFAFWNDSPV